MQRERDLIAGGATPPDYLNGGIDMNDAEKILYDNFFTRYGSACTQAEHTIHVYATRPDVLYKTSDVMRADKNAADTIAHLEKQIDALRLYRRELCNRYNEICTSATVPGIKLIRERRWYEKKIVYKLVFFTRFIDTGEDVIDKVDIFKGSDRSKAISSFNEYVKKHPNFISSMDINKSKFER